MGDSNSDKFLAEKNPSGTKELSCSVRPPSELQETQCQTASSLQDASDHDELQHTEGEREPVEEVQVEDKKMLELVPPETPKTPSLEESKVNESGDHEEEINDGFKTPTSLQSKIPAMLKCPPAPRKPKFIRVVKWKDDSRRNLIKLDLTKEIESLFPPALLADLGKKIRKARQGSDFQMI